MTNALSYFSTFSGIGGFEAAISAVHPHAVCIGYSEINKYADQVYRRHFPTHRNFGDITTIDAANLPDFELLVGGFPCQTFSMAGQRAGFADQRGSLFFEVARLAWEKQPRLLLLENVKGLLSHDEGRTFLAVITTLDELGYDLQWQVLNSRDFGLAQFRQRVFIVGHLRGTGRSEIFPLQGAFEYRDEIQLQKHAGSGIRPIWRLRDTMCTRLDTLRRNTIRRLTPREYERLQGFRDDWTMGISDAQRYKCLGNAVSVPVVKAVMEKLIC